MRRSQNPLHETALGGLNFQEIRSIKAQSEKSLQSIQLKAFSAPTKFVTINYFWSTTIRTVEEIPRRVVVSSKLTAR